MSAIITQYSSSSIQVPSDVNAFSKMMENPQEKMVIIQSSWSVGDVNQFHADFDVASQK